jgi:hypothetical protein
VAAKLSALEPRAIPTLYAAVVDRTRPPLERVREIEELRIHLRAFQMTLVDEARDAGATWEQVGGLLGISRQAAEQRFRTTWSPRASTRFAR